MIENNNLDDLTEKAYNHPIDLSDVLRVIEAQIAGGYFEGLKAYLLECNANYAIEEKLGASKEDADQIALEKVSEDETNDQNLPFQVTLQIQKNIIMEFMKTLPPKTKVSLSKLNWSFLLQKRHYQILDSENISKTFLTLAEQLVFEAVTSMLEARGIRFDTKTSMDIEMLRVELEHGVRKILMEKLNPVGE